MIVTVTMNAALDRTLTVPNFQQGHRHRASEKLTLAGGKGITIARAEAPRRARRRDRSRGRPERAAHPRGARRGGHPLRLRAHRGRVADVDSGLRPDVRDVHRGDGVGPARPGVRARGAPREARLPRARRRTVVFAGTLPRGVADDFYAEAIRAAARRAHRARRGGRAAAGGPRGRAVPRLAEPHRGGGGGRAGVRRTATSSTRSSGSRTSAPQRAHHVRARLFRLGARRARTAQAVPCRRADGGRRLRVGSGAVLLAGFIAAWLESATPEDALRRAVAAGAASTLSVGAGRFDPEDVGRLLPGVHVEELTAVASA